MDANERLATLRLTNWLFKTTADNAVAVAMAIGPIAANFDDDNEGPKWP
jgi:hypothetical protein